jgi:hypothetical protein
LNHFIIIPNDVIPCPMPIQQSGTVSKRVDAFLSVPVVLSQIENPRSGDSFRLFLNEKKTKELWRDDSD